MCSKKELSHPIVAHVMRTYLGLSETFIYSILMNARRFQPVVVADAIDNLNMFPYEPLYALSSIPRYSWWWRVNSLHYRLTDKGVFFEYMTYVRHVIKKTNTRSHSRTFWSFRCTDASCETGVERAVGHDVLWLRYV